MPWGSTRWGAPYSFVVLLYVHVESKLSELCDTIRKARFLPIGSTDLRGSVLERTKRYLFRFASFQQGSADWNAIDELTKVRDCIVHTNGNVRFSRDGEYLRRLVAAEGPDKLLIAQIPERDGDWLVIKEPYTLLLAKRVREFFEAMKAELTDHGA